MFTLEFISNDWWSIEQWRLWIMRHVKISVPLISFWRSRAENSIDILRIRLSLYDWQKINRTHVNIRNFFYWCLRAFIRNNSWTWIQLSNWLEFGSQSNRLFRHCSLLCLLIYQLSLDCQPCSRFKFWFRIYFFCCRRFLFCILIEPIGQFINIYWCCFPWAVVSKPQIEQTDFRRRAFDYYFFAFNRILTHAIVVLPTSSLDWHR